MIEKRLPFRTGPRLRTPKAFCPVAIVWFNFESLIDACHKVVDLTDVFGGRKVQQFYVHLLSIVVSRTDVVLPQVVSHRGLVRPCRGLDCGAFALGRLAASPRQADA